jgi:glutaminyl-tRNA synthetase
VRLYDRLFTVPQPDASGRDFLESLNPASQTVVTAWLEPGASDVKPDERVQFERHGYFVADVKDSKDGAPVFNRITTLKDSWAARPG